jgi:hypothetical protein
VSAGSLPGEPENVFDGLVPALVMVLLEIVKVAPELVLFGAPHIATPLIFDMAFRVTLILFPEPTLIASQYELVPLRTSLIEDILF